MPQTIEGDDILDLAVKIVVRARIDGIERSQIGNLLTSVEIPLDPKMSLYFVALYAYSRVGRKEISNPQGVGVKRYLIDFFSDKVRVRLD